MIIEKVYLWKDKPEVFMISYRIEDSAQYRQKEKRPAILICPGGGFQYQADREGEPVALAYAAQGFQCFVLYYSVNTAFPACLLDAAKAVQCIREHADKWMVDPEKIAIEGNSAGGYIAAALPSLAETDIFTDVAELKPEMIKPNVAIVGYGTIDQEIQFESPYIERISEERRREIENLNTMLYGEWPTDRNKLDKYNPLAHISSEMVPSFVWTTAEDSLVPAGNAIRMMAELEKNGIPVEGHFFGWGEHGMSLATLPLKRGNNVDPHIAKWFELSVEWLIHIFDLWK